MRRKREGKEGWREGEESENNGGREGEGKDGRRWIREKKGWKDMKRGKEEDKKMFIVRTGKITKVCVRNIYLYLALKSVGKEVCITYVVIGAICRVLLQTLSD